MTAKTMTAICVGIVLGLVLSGLAPSQAETLQPEPDEVEVVKFLGTVGGAIAVSGVGTNPVKVSVVGNVKSIARPQEWEYKVAQFVPGAGVRPATPATIERELNKLGSYNWEGFAYASGHYLVLLKRPK